MAGGHRSLCRSDSSRSRRPTAAAAATEAPRAEDRAAVRRPARPEAGLLRRQQGAGREAAAVVAALASQGPAGRVEKLKRELIDLKQQRQGEEQQLADYYAQQIKELEDKFQKKVREIGQIQLELKLLKEFCRERAAMQKELEDKRLEEDGEKKEKIQFEKVGIGELTWEQKERVLRLLFAKMNAPNPWKYSRVLATSAPAPDDTKEESRVG